MGPAALVSILMVGAPSTAADVRALIDEADFSGAKDALLSAESRPDLGRDEYVDLLELRALIHLAFGNEADVRKALRRLAALDFNRRFPASTNPDLVAEYLRQRADLTGPLTISVDRRSMPDGFELSVSVSNAIDVAGRPVLALLGPDGWVEQSGLRTRVWLDPGERAPYRVRVSVGSVVVAEVLGEVERPAAQSGVSPWWWAGAAAVVVGAAVAVIVATQSDDTLPVAGAPEVVWP